MDMASEDEVHSVVFEEACNRVSPIETKHLDAEDSGRMAGLHGNGVMEADHFDQIAIGFRGQQCRELMKLGFGDAAVGEAVRPEAASIGIEAVKTDRSTRGVDGRIKLQGVATTVIIAVCGLGFWTGAAP